MIDYVRGQIDLPVPLPVATSADGHCVRHKITWPSTDAVCGRSVLADPKRPIWFGVDEWWLVTCPECHAKRNETEERTR